MIPYKLELDLSKLKPLVPKNGGIRISLSDVDSAVQVIDRDGKIVVSVEGTRTTQEYVDRVAAKAAPVDPYEICVAAIRYSRGVHEHVFYGPTEFSFDSYNYGPPLATLPFVVQNENRYVLLPRDTVAAVRVDNSTVYLITKSTMSVRVFDVKTGVIVQNHPAPNEKLRDLIDLYLARTTS